MNRIMTVVGSGEAGGARAAPRELDGRVAVVTGPTSGIGLGIAEALAARGARVVLNGLSEQEAVRKVLLAEQPAKRFAAIEEIAAAAAFPCSIGATSITGIALPVAGGWTAHRWTAWPRRAP